jgi:hypothetical protein
MFFLAALPHPDFSPGTFCGKKEAVLIEIQNRLSTPTLALLQNTGESILGTDRQDR